MTNQAELVFNQVKHIDMYFDEEASENWQLSEKGHCFVCNKHKFLVLFFDVNEPVKGLKEIVEKDKIDLIKENLNINYNDDDIAPFVCGTIVNGGFQRKLKMMRADLFSMLAVSLSN